MATPVIRSGYGFVAPALILLIAMNIFPLLYSIYLSFTNAELTGGELAGVGGRNYDMVFRASMFADALRTTAAFVAAGAGLCVAKHGNRAATSQCGSADVLKALGVNVEADPETVGRLSLIHI